MPDRSHLDVTSGILKPLAVFCSQSQSQRYIRSVRNLGDAWRTLDEEPIGDSDRDSVSVETTFDLTFRVTNGLDDTASVNMTTSGAPSSTEPFQPTQHRRNYQIFADYGTDFIWRCPDDVMEENDEECYVEADEVLSSFPPSVLEQYNAWVDCYSRYFKMRCEATKDYTANVFLSASEEVAWNIAGYLLAWRIAISPETGTIRYSAGKSKYFLEQGNETRVTVQFLKDQMDILAEGVPSC